LDVGLRYSIEVVGNFLLILGLAVYGSKLFAEYHSRGKWAKNVTGLLAGIGMICLALAFALTRKNVEVLLKIAESGVSNLFLDVSSALLLAAMAAYGIITYWKPLRLLRERDIEKGLKSELPKIR
jgi:hypothetical protein